MLSNLDADNRRRLLAHLPPQDAARLRAAAAALSDVDPLEIRRTVSAFVGRISAAQQQPQAGAPASATPENLHADSSNAGRRDPADVRSDRTASHPGSSAASPSKGAADSSGGLKFLNDVSDATLLRAIGSEHPQTIAVVLASIDPRQAGRLLQQLPPQPRGEAIRRLSRLEEVPQDVIDDIGRHLRGLIGTVDQVGSGEGRRLLTSIFSALGAEDRDALGAGLVDTDGEIAAALAEAERAQPRSTRSNQDATENHSGQGREARSGEAHQTAPQILRLDAQRSNDPMSGLDAGQLNSGRLASQPHSPGQADVPGLPEIAEADAVLENLPAARLREVLAELTAREALLTLCGVTPRCVRRLLRTMPRRGAKEVRQRLHSLGPLDLSEIDRAKQKAAAVAVGSAAPTTARAA